MRYKGLRPIIFIVLFFSTVAVFPNEPIGSYVDEYYEIIALAGIIEKPFLIYRSLSRNCWQPPLSDAEHPWKARLAREKAWNRSDSLNWNLISPMLMLSCNTTYAHGANDGALWQGKGVNGMFSGGANLSWKWFALTLSPELWLSQNLPFELLPSDPSLSAYSYPNWGSAQIDMPQRFGEDAALGLGFGQSDIRLNIGWFTMGFSTENLWFGSAQVNPIIMSNNASGFPHLDIGTRRVHTIVGDVEANIIWGRLTESEYFDTDQTNDYRLFSSFTLAYNPSFLDSLTLGVSRVLYTPGTDLWFYDFIKILDPRILFGRGTSEYPGSDDRDQMISLTIDWFLQQSMFNVYLEWARNDYSPKVRYFFTYPQHSQAYTLGFRKLLTKELARIFSITAEITELVRSKDVDDICPIYYRHHQVIQGYTNLGQVMGAAIGPGSNSQFLKLDYFDRWGSVGLFLQRIAYDYDYYYASTYPAVSNPNSNEVEWTLGTNGVIFLKLFDLGFEIALSQMLNWNYIRKNDVWNLYAMLTFKYR